MNENETYDFDKLEFYKLLEKRYKRQLDSIKESSGVICIPAKNSLKPNLNLNDENNIHIYNFFIKHLFIPSPYFKDQFLSFNYQNDAEYLVLAIDSDTSEIWITDSNRRQYQTKIRILSTQTAYTNDYKEYFIYVIEHPILILEESVNNSYLTNIFSYYNAPKTNLGDRLFHHLEHLGEYLMLGDLNAQV
jgi:hypothetical protein